MKKVVVVLAMLMVTQNVMAKTMCFIQEGRHTADGDDFSGEPLFSVELKENATIFVVLTGNPRQAIEIKDPSDLLQYKGKTVAVFANTSGATGLGLGHINAFKEGSIRVDTTAGNMKGEANTYLFDMNQMLGLSCADMAK